MRLRSYLILLALAVGLPQVSQAADYSAVQLRIQTNEEIIFDREVYVSSDGCVVTDSAGVEHTIKGSKAICALVTGGHSEAFEYSVDNFEGVGLFLNSVNEYVTDSVNYSEFWSLFVNYAGAEVGLADYTVTDGDEVLLSFGPYAPSALRLKFVDNEVIAGQPVVVRVQQLVDADKQKFAPVAGATVYFTVGETNITAATTDAAGKVRYLPKKSGDISVYAAKDGAVRSETERITVFEKNTDAKPLADDELVTMANLGADLLKSKIDDAGLIYENQSLTEWAAIGLVADGQNANRLAEAVVAYEPKVEDGTNEIARHILALEALGYDPTDVNGINYVERLKNTQDGDQFGNSAYVNDDIFAGLALLAAGEFGDSEAVTVALQAAKAGINKDGGVAFAVASETSDVDTTAFFVQLIVEAQTEGNTTPIKVARGAAVHYLLQQQNLDGGFGYAEFEPSNAASTAVVVQALNSLGREVNHIRRNKRTAYNFLKAVQNDAGQFSYNLQVSSNYDVLNTAYALVGLTDHSLPLIVEVVTE